MLSKKTKYGIKALTHLARQENQAPVQIATISEAENISQKFLESILLTLKKNGILSSKKGMVPCVSLNYYEKCDDCPDEHACSVHKLMIEVRDSTLDIFNNKSLADLIA